MTSITTIQFDASQAWNRERTEILPPLQKEEGFSSLKYCEIALTIAAIAAVLFTVCFPAAVVLIAVASWYLLSATILLMNQAAVGTCLEGPMQRLHAIAMEVNSIIAALIVLPLTFFDQCHAPQGNLYGRPILMINGYLSFGSTWYYLRQRLVEAGFGPVYTMNVGSGDSIATYAKQVQEKAREIQKETGRKDLTLIGHSKGGLVSSYCATQLTDTISEVVTIGSPLAGTPVAYIGLGEDAREMRPDSEFNVELRKNINQHPEIRFFHIASEEDEIVPLSSALLGEDHSRHLVLKDLGHLSLVFSSRVADQICAWI